MSSDALEHPPLDDALVDLVAQALDGLEREGESALDALCGAHPDRADALRSQVARLRELGLASAPTLGAAPPERLGPFRLLERLGGGGMGVVYQAVQDGLDRRVALKLVRPEHLYFPGARERFRREVQVLARLQHPGIVPVHAGGEEAGIPYLAMELVRGASLEEVLSELRGRDPAELDGHDLSAAVEAVVARREEGQDSSPALTSRSRSPVPLFAGNWITSCVHLARQLAQALQHAHEQGVLHRDIKPSNVMLTPDGRVLLLDFGLAASSGSERLTGTGQPLGSPAYMSPEQIRGDRELDVRSDVYSLGVTLYEAVTLDQPFVAQGLEATRQRVLAARPPAPRDVNAAVTRDADTVILAAIDSDPSRRYPSAVALAADLSNLLELRPVGARRAGSVLRARRWTQRHPARAVALAAGVLLLVGGPLAYAVVTERAAQRVTEALAEANAQRSLALASFDRARRAVDELLTQVSEEQLLHVPHLEPLRRRLLESALRFQEELLAERGEDPGLRLDVATAGARAALLLNELGRHDEALTAAQRASGLAAELVDAAPADADLLELLGDARAAEAEALLQLGSDQDAAAAAQDVLVHRRRRMDLLPRSSDAHHDVDAALGLSGAIAGRAGRMEEAARLYAEQAAFDQGLVGRFPEDPGSDLLAVGNQVVALTNLADSLMELDRGDDARAVLERAIALSEPRMDELLSSSAASRGAAVARIQAGRLRGQAGDPVQAEALVRAGLSILAALEARAPNDVELRRLAASGWNALGVLLMRQAGREGDARQALTTSIEMQRRLVEESPATPLYALNLSGALINMAAQMRDAGEGAAAERLFVEALEVLERLIAAGLVEDEARDAAFLAGWHLGLTCLDGGDAEGAAEAASRLMAARPGEARAARIGAGLLARAADLLARSAAGDALAAARRVELLERSLVALDDAIAAGYGDVGNLESAADLSTLREHPRFGAALQAARANVPEP